MRHFRFQRRRQVFMTKIGFIGLGIMGGPMAANLVKAGFDVAGYNRSQAKVERFVEAGGTGAATVAEAVRDRDVIITCLPDSPDVEEMALGDDGVFAHAREGALFIDMSTIQPATARKIAEAGRARGFGVLDAPISGGERGAIEATLSIMVGGEGVEVETARPVFEAMGKTIVHVGPAGAGQTVKAANQLICAVNIQAVAEAIVFLEANSVDPTTAINALSGGLAGSAVLERRAPSMVERNFQPGFRAELHDKDLRILTAAARDAGVTIPLGTAAAQLMAALVAQGDGKLDNTALLKLVEELSGR
ncbi:2-hydroxy-3-oxopropionate reductase [Arthrobacter crystallopoietes]|nr:2-hydroxy-3-oxopropionate reductase [Arthrobacter crystallopoietes]